jgi:hypothetical protein
MLVYLKANPAAFDDGEVRILTAAFDKAWESVQAGGAKFDTDREASIATCAAEALRREPSARQRLADVGRLFIKWESSDFSIWILDRAPNPPGSCRDLVERKHDRARQAVRVKILVESASELAPDALFDQA